MEENNIKQEILLTKQEMHRMNVNSPHYKELQKHIRKLERRLNDVGARY